MAYEKKIRLSLNCGLDLLAEVLYGKWKIRLLYFIYRAISDPVFSSERSRTLSDVSPKVEYSLTDLGKSLIPVIHALGEWGDSIRIS
jgi:DNA-binding HxlR family transcriptional regulator